MAREFNLDKLVAELSKTQDIYVELVMQRDKCKSTKLYELLNTEICCYMSLSDIFGELVTMFSKKMEEATENTNTYLYKQLELINSINNPQIALQNIAYLKKNYNLLCAFDDFDFLTFVLFITNYNNIISRNYKDWGKFLKAIGEAVVDVAVGSTPVLSELKNMYDKIKNIAEIVNEFESNSTDYSEVDKMLFEIESHIVIMSEAISEFKNAKEIFESAENGSWTTS